MLTSLEKKKIANDKSKQEIRKINDEKFEITSENGNYSVETYKTMISQLPIKISMLSQEITVEQMFEIIAFFRLLIKFPEIPKEMKNDSFMLSVLAQVQRFQNDELFSKFVMFINEFYEIVFCPPPSQLIDFVINLIFNVQLPLQGLQQTIIKNLLIFISSIYNYLDDKMINTNSFYSKLIIFFNLSPEFNSTLTYLFTSLICHISSGEVLSNFITIISFIYQNVVPYTTPTVHEDEDSLRVIMNIVSIVSGFALCDKKLGKGYFKQHAENIILPLYDFWGLSNDINSNLVDLLETVSRTTVSMFKDPNQAELQMTFIKIIDSCLSKGGSQIILSSLMASTDYTTESLLLLKQLIQINFTRQTSFLFKDQCEFFPIFYRVLYYCLEGRISERCAAGCCLSKIIRIYPNFMLQYLMCNTEVCSYLSLNLADISDISDLAFINLISDLLTLENEKLERSLIKALFVIAKRFYDMDKMHEFREECALYSIQEKVNAITENSKNIKTYNVGNDFNLTAFGVLPFSEVDVPY